MTMADNDNEMKGRLGALLAQHEAEPAADAWPRLEAHLADRRRPLLFWLPILLLLLGGGAGSYYYISSRPASVAERATTPSDVQIRNLAGAKTTTAPGESGPNNTSDGLPGNEATNSDQPNASTSQEASQLASADRGSSLASNPAAVTNIRADSAKAKSDSVAEANSKSRQRAEPSARNGQARNGAKGRPSKGRHGLKGLANPGVNIAAAPKVNDGPASEQMKTDPPGGGGGGMVLPGTEGIPMSFDEMAIMRARGSQGGNGNGQGGGTSTPGGTTKATSSAQALAFANQLAAYPRFTSPRGEGGGADAPGSNYPQPSPASSADYYAKGGQLVALGGRNSGKNISLVRGTANRSSADEADSGNTTALQADSLQAPLKVDSLQVERPATRQRNTLRPQWLVAGHVMGALRNDAYNPADNDYLSGPSVAGSNNRGQGYGLSIGRMWPVRGHWRYGAALLGSYWQQRYALQQTTGYTAATATPQGNQFLVQQQAVQQGHSTNAQVAYATPQLMLEYLPIRRLVIGANVGYQTQIWRQNSDATFKVALPASGFSGGAGLGYYLRMNGNPLLFMLNYQLNPGAPAMGDNALRSSWNSVGAQLRFEF
jgi:hypothetical protein